MLALVIYPNLDYCVFAFFHQKNQGFTHANNQVVRLLHLSIPWLSKLFFLSIIIAMIHTLWKNKSLKKLASSYLSYLLVACIIGPGIIVNYLFKGHFGRARPSQILDFGGLKKFSPAFKISDQCLTNCSFSSGHAAMAFYFTSLAYALLLEKNNSTTLLNKFSCTTIYIIFIIFGCLVSLSRILMGGHFLSDVITSCFVVLTINHLLYIYWKNLRG